MADMRIAHPSGTGFVAAGGTRRGDMFTADWKQRMILEGRAYMVNVGALSTPIVGGGAGTVLDLDQPEFIISVPSGTSLIPLRVAIQCQPPLIAADNDEIEALIAVDRTAACAGDGTATAETPFNLRTDNPRASACTATSAYTADVTDPVLGIELARVVKVADVQGTAANAKFDALDLVYEPTCPPVIVGPAMLVGYWGGTVATSGFAEVAWIEVPTTEITAHSGS